MNIRMIAQEAGVSVATVSRVLNHPDQVSEETKKRILEVMQQHNYQPNWYARALNLNRTNVIGMVLPDIKDPLYISTVQGAEEVAFQKGYNTLLCNTNLKRDRESEYISMLLQKKVDGLILVSSFLEDAVLEEIQRAKTPYVYVGSNCRLRNTNMVRADLEGGAYEATCHLLELGRERVAYVGCQDSPEEEKEKTRGFARAMEENGRTLSPEYQLTVSNSTEGGYVAAQKLLSLARRPDAILAGSDMIAIGISKAVQEEGMEIPRQLSIIGFGNLDLDTLVSPKLTSVEKPAYRMGLLSARLLFDLIEQPDQEEPEVQSIILQSKLKIRSSCGVKSGRRGR